MATSAQVALGTTLHIDITGATTFTVVAEIHEMSGPNIERAVIDATNFSSGQVREKIVGLVDLGELTLGIRYVPAASGNVHYTLLQELSLDGSTRILGGTTNALDINLTPPNWKITFIGPGAGADITWIFRGWVTSYSLSLDLDSPVEANVGITLASMAASDIAIA